MLIKGPMPHVGDVARAMAAAPIRKGSVTGASCPTAAAAACPTCDGPVPARVHPGGRRRVYCSRRCGLLANARKWRLENRERVRAVNLVADRKRRLNNPERRAYLAEWRRRNPERVCAHRRSRLEVVGQEQLRAYAAEWRRRNPERVRAHSRKGNRNYRLNHLEQCRARGREYARQLRRLRPLMDALVAACMRPLDHLVDFTDEHLAELRRLLRVIGRQFSALERVH